MTYIGDLSTLSIEFTKISRSYTFDASAKNILINDTDYVRPLLVINTTQNETIYNPLTGNGGTVLGRELQLDFDTTGQGDGDTLLIIYEYNNYDRVDYLLAQIIERLDFNNKLMQALLG